MGILMPLDELARELDRFLGEPVVGEIAAQDQDVGFSRCTAPQTAAAAARASPRP